MQIEKAEKKPVDDGASRGNCCVTYANPSDPSDFELALMRGGSNCCVSFQPKTSKAEKRVKIIIFLAACAMVSFMVWTVLLVQARHKNGRSCADCSTGES